MDNFEIISAKIPKEVYNELVLRIPQGERSSFIREAIFEKLQVTPRPNKLFKLEQRIEKLELALSEVRKVLADLEVLSYGKGTVNPHSFCIDNVDHQIVDFLLRYEGATTTQLAESLGTNRWFILNRLRKIQKRSKTQLGKSVVEYSASEKYGKRKAWWINEELVHL